MALIHLVHRGDIVLRKGTGLLSMLRSYEIEIVLVDKRHLHTMENLTPIYGHNDPNDHIIIAQAISDKITLISSDTKSSYTRICLQLALIKTYPCRSRFSLPSILYTPQLNTICNHGTFSLFYFLCQS